MLHLVGSSILLYLIDDARSNKNQEFYVHVTVHRDEFLYNKNQLVALISQIYFFVKLYMFRTVPLSIIRSLFTVHSAMVYVTQVCRQLSSRTRMEHSSYYITCRGLVGPFLGFTLS